MANFESSMTWSLIHYIPLCSMPMDDTAILATSGEIILKRYDTLVTFCEDYDMMINEDKTKFMVINGSASFTEED